MKYTFDITVGSRWPDKGEGIPGVSFSLPVGGIPRTVTVEFEPTDSVEYKSNLKLAEAALSKSMERQDYHIWYWVQHTEGAS